MLVAELIEQGFLESAQRSILVAGNSQGCGLVAGCVDFDLMLQRIVVEIVYSRVMLDIILSLFLCPLVEQHFGGAGQRTGGAVGLTYAGSIQEQTPSPTERRISYFA